MLSSLSNRLLSLFEDIVSFNDVKYLLSAISTSRLLDHLSQVSELLNGIGNLLSETQYDAPDDQKEYHTASKD